MKKIPLFIIIIGVTVFLQSCIYPLLTSTEHDCELTFTYEFDFNDATLVSGSFKGFSSTFEYSDVLAKETVNSSTCYSIDTGTVVEKYKTVRLDSMMDGSLRIYLLGPNGYFDFASFPIDTLGNVYEPVENTPYTELIQKSSSWGTVTFDIANKKLILSGKRNIKEKVGKDD
ncbi:MAG TPA: hypothetical protein PLD12_00930 [Bacteroidales bacterium]|nr:hypothetical protein [Bacteroidales bacterium]HOK97680.1 hypothetical protein [Bacteroidales bacterium]HPO65411.1 hypothetical protein [Bacteroidales bacterium]